MTSDLKPMTEPSEVDHQIAAERAARIEKALRLVVSSWHGGQHNWATELVAAMQQAEAALEKEG